jgi:hypothetical protein
MATGRAAVANAITTYIKDRMIQPIARNVPMHAVADAWPLPVVGDVLRVPRSPSIGEAVTLSKDTVYTVAVASTTYSANNWDLSVPYDEYTILEFGLVTQVNKWANFVTALDIAKQIGNRLSESAGMTMNSLSYDALVAQAGLQWLRVDGQAETNVEVAFSINSATGLATTGFRSDLTDINSWWNNGQVTMTSGVNRGLSRAVTGFTQSNGVVVCDAFPAIPANGDTGFISVLGNGTSSGPADLANTDTITLAQLYRARERCLRFGAGGLGIEDEVMDVTGSMESRDGALKQGMVFMPTKMVHELQVTLAGNATAQDQAFWQTSEGLRRAVGGVILNVGGLMVVPVNYYKRAAISDGTLSTTTGACHPSVILYPHAFGCTTLMNNPGDRQGMDITVKAPGKSDIGHLWSSIKYQGELDLINKYFCANSLYGAVLWAGTSLV